MQRTTFSVTCEHEGGKHQMVCHQWGDETNIRVLLCVHGIARNGRDFDVIARELSKTYRVICPDMVGRGQSDWLPDATAYAVPQYISDIMTLISAIGASEVDFLGTSMGGIIGMCIASEMPDVIHSLVLNDIGPFASQSALAPIGGYIGEQCFSSHAQALAYIKTHYTSWGQLTSEQWNTVTKHSTRIDEGKGLCLHYDPAIKDNAVLLGATDLDLWSFWHKIQCPVAVLRGADSALLSAVTLEQMQQSKAQLSALVVKGVGHVPPLLSQQEISWVSQWFDENGLTCE